nr:EOG090X027R [Artemia franciscana]
MEVNKEAVLSNYAAIAHATYEDSLISAKKLKTAIQALVDNPSQATLDAAKAAWVESRVPYQQSEAYRFGNAIVDDFEGKVNAWPLDEGLIDYVDASYGDTSDENPFYTANVIANKKIELAGQVVDASKITKTLLADTLQEADEVEANVATGYHAIEFLLWGQDLNGTDAGAGNRPYTDFDTKNCTGGNCDRRAVYLTEVTDLLIDDLADITAKWAPKGEAVAALGENGLSAILTGLGSLSYGELADNTHNSHYYDIVGMQNVYEGAYKRIDGSWVKGASIKALIAKKDGALADQLSSELKASVAAGKVMVDRAEGGEAYDQMIGEGNVEEVGYPNEDANSMLIRLSIPPQNDEQKALLKSGRVASIDEPTYGGQLQDIGVSGFLGEAKISVDWHTHIETLDDGTEVELRRPEFKLHNIAYGDMHKDVMMSPRIANQMNGMGLINAISDQDLLANEDVEDKDGDGISGKAQYVWDIEADKLAIGRFGWKGDMPNLKQQVAAAFSGDIGINSSLFPKPSGDCTENQPSCLTAPNGNLASMDDLEISDELLEMTTTFNAHIAQRNRKNAGDKEVLLAPLKDFNQKAKKLDASIGENCTINLAEIETNYKSAVLAWMPLQAMRFDAFDQDNRALRAYFWPNSRGYKQIRKILPKGVVSKLEYDKFSKTSVAVQGLTMLEWFLMHKESPFIANKEGQKAFACQYMDAIATNMVNLSVELIKTYSIGGEDRKMLLSPSAENATYAEEKEVTLQFFKAIHAMSELVMGQKLNRPIATELKNMRPKRLELWRSELTLPNIEQNIKAIKLGIEAFDPVFSQNQEGIDVALSIHADIRNIEKKMVTKMQRRTFIKSALASLPLLAGSKVVWAKEGGIELAGHIDNSHLKGEYFLAGKDEFGGHQAYIVGSDFEIKRQVELPNRFHGQARSNDGHLAIFSRRPLDHLCLIRPHGDIEIKQCRDDRHFFGHGAFSLDSRLLFTSENLFHHEDSEQTGRIGVWDVKRAELISDFWSGGIGPHQIMLSPNGQYLVVANGGILTHPDFPRKKLNLDEMQANIAIIHVKTGKVEKRWMLPKELHQLSMRHIDVNAKGEIIIAMQYQGKRQDQVPLIATISKEMKLSFAKMDVGAIAAHQQYIGSICYDRSGEYFAATSPRALCAIPHRGGMSAEGIGDGAGVNIDLSLNFFRKVTGEADLELGQFAVANFFLPKDADYEDDAITLVEEKLMRFRFPILAWRDVPVNNAILTDASVRAQLSIKQVVFGRSDKLKDATWHEFDMEIARALQSIENECYDIEGLDGFYPCSMSARTQVLKGRLNSNEVIPYFEDLRDPDHEIHSIYFHSRYSTNTEPATMMAQPFRRMAHNGELNTDKKNRLSEASIARQQGKEVHFPKGQSDSARLDQTIARRILDDGYTVVEAIVAMMPPAWENMPNLDPNIAAMLEYFSLFEEKNDGPAAIIFGNGQYIGARLDRLGLRPLRSVETDEYLAVMSEAGQVSFPPETVIMRGRIEAGDMLFWSHEEKRSYTGEQYLTKLSQKQDYVKLLADAKKDLEDLALDGASKIAKNSEISVEAQHVGYYLNDESFRFLLDPMLDKGAERVYAMGYGLAPNALTRTEGGMSQYFSQRFAQVTNPPLDSIREADGMTLRVALGGKPGFVEGQKQIVIQSPILLEDDFNKILQQDAVKTGTIDILYSPNYENAKRNASRLELAIDELCDEVEAMARDNVGIIILSDRNLSQELAAIPLLLAVAAANQRLIKTGLRFNSSLVLDSGQLASTHDCATAFGFGASALFPISAQNRAEQLDAANADKLMKNFKKSIEKSLMKTMGKFGLCTAESYIGGEFFESNFLDTKEPHLKRSFPHIDAPVGGVHFIDIANSAAEWHYNAMKHEGSVELPNLGLFKERADGGGHSFGVTSVREYGNMLEEDVAYVAEKEPNHITKLGMDELASDFDYQKYGYEALEPNQIDEHKITKGYYNFVKEMIAERDERPATLRDVMALPIDVTEAETVEQFDQILGSQHIKGNRNYQIRGLKAELLSPGIFKVCFPEAKQKGKDLKERLKALAQHVKNRFSSRDYKIKLEEDHLQIAAAHSLLHYLSHIQDAPCAIGLDKVQPAHQITRTFSSGAMSYGALVKPAHRAVAQGTNIVGGLSNSGEGGEEFARSNSILASRIRQFASGRFGVWAGYLADPLLEEVEIKIAQGAKPGEGGQLPSKKVTVEIASMRGGTPGVELVSPPPHHDTYSIEDLAQLIHDCKATRRRVIVKLVSSEGIGTIAVGVAKAGADVINVAAGTGGTGAAQVTSLKHTGRAGEIGLAEVHKALCQNGLRDKVILRTSGAHQVGLDIVKSAILGADSFEFGTAALMMLGCVQAKTCNVKCPVGLTTNPEAYDGDARILAQYYMNVAHEARLILAELGVESLKDIRGRTDLLHLVDHEKMVGMLDLRGLLAEVETAVIEKPIYVQADFRHDDRALEVFKQEIVENGAESMLVEGKKYRLNNRHKSVGGQLAIDIERMLNYELSKEQLANIKNLYQADNGRYYLGEGSVNMVTTASAGQSYGAFNIAGMNLRHEGTCNDGVAKGISGGVVSVVRPENDGVKADIQNALIGNFALFGATGGMVFIEGEAGDRFAVRNSGAMSVVEGVGDFGCEYMINGMVLNIGTFGKGFANDAAEAQSHKDIILYMLKAHFDATGSLKAKALIENFEAEAQNFVYCVPKALSETQSSEALVKLGQGRAVLNGQVPNYQEVDGSLSFELLNAYGVMNVAKKVVHQLAKKQDVAVNPLFETKAAKNLVKTEDYALIEALSKECKSALNGFNDEELAIMLADKRIRDYKKSLSLRDVQTIYSTGANTRLLDQENNAQAAALKPLTILYGTQTGNSESVGEQLASMASEYGLAASLVDMDEFEVEQFADVERLLIVCATYGEGEMPDNAELLWEAISEDDAPKLDHLFFGVLALGDTSYDDFCKAGIDWDERLAELGATRIVDRVDCDVDFEDPAETWCQNALEAIKDKGSDAAAAAPAAGAAPAKKDKPKWDRKNPFPSELKLKRTLSAETSSKQIVHYELSLKDSGLSYEAGDALNVMPQNDPELVQLILAHLGLSGDEKVDGLSLKVAMQKVYDIKLPTANFMDLAAKQSGDEELNRLLENNDREALNDYLWGRDIVDFIIDLKLQLSAEEFVANLRKLQPRAYSISSSSKAHEDEVHLTISSVRYESFGRKHEGVASCYLSDRLDEGKNVGVYFSPNKAFRVPEDKSLPIIMVGPGTGIAPFRAFLEEREATDASGENWLFFGDRHEKDDYIYKDEISAWQESGHLNKLDLAFSRDQKEKIYVQTRMMENGAELFSWLEKGAYFYVCGDATYMAKDVDQALNDIVKEHGGFDDEGTKAYMSALKKAKRYVRDVY